VQAEKANGSALGLRVNPNNRVNPFEEGVEASVRARRLALKERERKTKYTAYGKYKHTHSSESS